MPIQGAGLVEDIGHPELVRLVLSQGEILTRTQAQLSDVQTQMARQHHQYTAQLAEIQQVFSEQLNALTTETRVMAQAQTQGRKDLDKLTNWQDWGVKLILGAVLLGMLGFFFGDRIGA